MVVVPEAVPARRAVLAGTVETAVNALWDAAPLVGDRVTVVGAGMVGCCVARLLARIPGARVTLVDVDAGRADVAAALGVDFALPADAAGGRDLVVHTSATSGGAAAVVGPARAGGHGASTSAGTATPRSRCRWAGPSTPVDSASGRARWASSRRPGAGTGRRPTVSRSPSICCEDPAFDALLTGVSRFDELPEAMSRLASGDLPALCHAISYDEEEAPCSA